MGIAMIMRRKRLAADRRPGAFISKTTAAYHQRSESAGGCGVVQVGVGGAPDERG